MELPEHHKPAKITIIPYYVAAALSIFIVSVLLLLSIPELVGHFFQPHLLAITHLTVLGWGTMIIIGASNQLMPVIADTKLYDERLPVICFILLAIGTCLLVHSFWGFQLGAAVFIGAFFIFTALILHSVNIFLSAKKSASNNIIIDCILTAHIWLILTAAIGITLLLNFRLGFLPEDHLHYLKVHASVGMAGWFLLLVIGVSSRLIPMFLLSRKEEKKYLVIAYYCINCGLALFLIDSTILHTRFGSMINLMLISAGILFYLAYVRICYNSAIRKKLDAAMKSSMTAVGVISIPLILLIISILYYREIPVSIVTGYGYSFFGGFVTLLIMAQTFKTLPFIIWMHLNSPDKLPELQPKDLFKESLVKLQTFLYLPGFLLVLAGILLKTYFLLYPGGILMIMASLIYCGHVFYVIGHLRKNGNRTY